jgi:hypothetical protein
MATRSLAPIPGGSLEPSSISPRERELCLVAARALMELRRGEPDMFAVVVQTIFAYLPDVSMKNWRRDLLILAGRGGRAMAAREMPGSKDKEKGRHPRAFRQAKRASKMIKDEAWLRRQLEGVDGGRA